MGFCVTLLLGSEWDRHYFGYVTISFVRVLQQSEQREF